MVIDRQNLAAIVVFFGILASQSKQGVSLKRV